jgi:preprotein translocase subunit SecF
VVSTKLVEYLSRKFVLSLASLFGVIGLVLLGKDGVSDQLTEIIGIILGTYTGGNVAEKYVEKKRGKKESPSEELPELNEEEAKDVT